MRIIIIWWWCGGTGTIIWKSNWLHHFVSCVTFQCSRSTTVSHSAIFYFIPFRQFICYNALFTLSMQMHRARLHGIIILYVSLRQNTSKFDGANGKKKEILSVWFWVQKLKMWLFFVWTHWYIHGITCIWEFTRSLLFKGTLNLAAIIT